MEKISFSPEDPRDDMKKIYLHLTNQIEIKKIEQEASGKISDCMQILIKDCENALTKIDEEDVDEMKRIIQLAKEEYFHDFFGEEDAFDLVGRFMDMKQCDEIQQLIDNAKTGKYDAKQTFQQKKTKD